MQCCSDPRLYLNCTKGDPTRPQRGKYGFVLGITPLVEDLLRDKREAVGILEGNEDEDEDEDDTRNQYCSDDSNCDGRDHMFGGDVDL